MAIAQPGQPDPNVYTPEGVQITRGTPNAGESFIADERLLSTPQYQQYVRSLTPEQVNAGAGGVGVFKDWLNKQGGATPGKLGRINRLEQSMQMQKEAGNEGAVERLGKVQERFLKRLPSPTDTPTPLEQNAMKSKVMPGETGEPGRAMVPTGVATPTAARAAETSEDRQAKIGAIIQGGNAEPEKILSLLNYDEKGQKIGDYTLDEVKRESINYFLSPEKQETAKQAKLKEQATQLVEPIKNEDVQNFLSNAVSGNLTAALDDIARNPEKYGGSTSAGILMGQMREAQLREQQAQQMSAFLERRMGQINDFATQFKGTVEKHALESAKILDLEKEAAVDRLKIDQVRIAKEKETTMEGLRMKQDRMLAYTQMKLGINGLTSSATGLAVLYSQVMAFDRFVEETGLKYTYAIEDLTRDINETALKFTNESIKLKQETDDKLLGMQKQLSDDVAQLQLTSLQTSQQAAIQKATLVNQTIAKLGEIQDKQVERNRQLLKDAQEKQEKALDRAMKYFQFDKDVETYKKQKDKEQGEVLASSLLEVDGQGNVQLPPRSQIDKIAESEGIDPDVFYGQIKAKQQDLMKKDVERRKAELDLDKLKKEILDKKISADRQDYLDAKADGEIDEKMTFFEYRGALESAKGDKTTTPTSYQEWKLAGGEAVLGKFGDWLMELKGKAPKNPFLGEGINRDILAAFGGLRLPSVTEFKSAKEILENYLNDGKVEEAKEFLKTQVFSSSSADERKVLEGKEDSIDALQRIRERLKVFEGKGGDTNIFTGKTESALQMLGSTQSGELAEIANDIALAIIDYRRAITGAAFTEGEAKSYKDVFPSIGKTTELNEAKINSLLTKLGSDTENFYKRRVGKEKYKAIFGNTVTIEKNIKDAFDGFVQELDDNSRTQVKSTFETLIRQGAKEEDAWEEILNDKQVPFKKTSMLEGFRTDRHNNPTAFTVDVARQGGLIEGVDFTQGDVFYKKDKNGKDILDRSGNKTIAGYTANLLGDPVDDTIAVINKIGFYTASGGHRWTHTQMSKEAWDKLSYDQKIKTVRRMYKNERGSGILFSNIS